MSYPRYQSHKEVNAAKITAIDPGADGGLTLELEGFASVKFSHLEMQRKPKPEPGWYLVQYDGGYISFSPALAFEDGYTAVSDATASIAHGATDEPVNVKVVKVEGEDAPSYTHAAGDFAGDGDRYGIAKEYMPDSAHPDAAQPGIGHEVEHEQAVQQEVAASDGHPIPHEAMVQEKSE